MFGRYYQKKQRKASKKGLWKVSRSFWRRLKQKTSICLRAIQKSFFEREKAKQEYGQKRYNDLPENITCGENRTASKIKTDCCFLATQDSSRYKIIC